MRAVAKRQGLAHATAAQPSGFCLFRDKRNRLDAAAFMRAIAPRLILALAASAIPIFFIGFYWDFIGGVLH